MRLSLVLSVALFALGMSSTSCSAPQPSVGSKGSRSSDSSDSETPSRKPTAREDVDPPGPAAVAAGGVVQAQASAGPAPSAACTGAAIAAFADQLATAARTSCMSNGPGVVTDTNFDCLRDPIKRLAPPFPAAA